MGQQTSSGKSARGATERPTAATATTAAMAAALLRLRAAEAKELLKVTRDDLAKIVVLLNDITENVDHSARLEFKIEGVTSDSVLWKVTAHVLCTKTCYAERDGNLVPVRSSEWRLSVRQILRLYRDAQRLFNLPQLFPPSSSFNTNAGDGSSVDVPDVSVDGPRPAGALSSRHTASPASADRHADDECCICLDSTVNTTLPCAHSFCEDCIGAWHQVDSACPMCKQCTENADDMWVMPAADPVPAHHCMNAVALISSLIEKLESVGHTSAHCHPATALAADAVKNSSTIPGGAGRAVPTDNQPLTSEAAERAEHDLICELE